MKNSATLRISRAIVAALAVGLVAAMTGATPPQDAREVERPLSSAVFVGAGDIAPVVEQYRAALGGPDNGGTPGTILPGYREISWDAVPDEFAAPALLPGDFFNGPAEPFARGVVLATPGLGVQVSADAENPSGAAARFGHINPTYTDRFSTFSAERLFSPIGSNVVNLTFRVSGTDVPALVTGFGAVYTDVNRPKTSFKFYDIRGRLLGRFNVPASVDGLSFLGVVFDSPVVARVRIQYGTSKLGPDDSAKKDVAVMDNFIYGEPVAASSVAGE
jgi:hypothetical protein